MIYFTLEEHLTALLIFILFGAVNGSVYYSFTALISYPFILLKGVFLSLFSKNTFSKPTIQIKNTHIGRNIGDFLFFLNFGITYVLLSYSLLDGETRVYTFLSYVLSMCVFKRILSRHISLMLEFILATVYKGFIFVFFYLTFPIKLVIKLLIKLISPIIVKLKIYGYRRELINYKILQSKKIEKFILSK